MHLSYAGDRVRGLFPPHVVVKLYQVVGAIAAVGAGTARPFMTIVFGSFVNQFNNKAEQDRSALLSAVDHNSLYFVYLFLGQFVLVYAYGALLRLAAARLVYTRRVVYLKTLLNQPVSFFETFSTGSVITDLSQNAAVMESGLSEPLGAAVHAASQVVASTIIAFLQSWRLTLAMSTSIVALFAIIFLTSIAKTKLEGRVKHLTVQASDLVEEVLSTMPTILAYGAVNKMANKYDLILADIQRNMFRAVPIQSLDYAASYFVLLCAYALSFWYGTLLVARGEILNGGKVVIVILCVNQATTALQRLLPAVQRVTKARAAACSLRKVIDLGCPDSDPQVLSNFPKLRDRPPSLEFRHVTFHYPSRPTIPALSDISFTIQPGKTTAIVGPSGSGKSTLVSLVERWFCSMQGEILMNGVAISHMAPHELRKSIGLVQQDAALFNDTIFQNVANGIEWEERSRLSIEQLVGSVRKACIDADVDSFVKHLPSGYDTVVGDAGSHLSGGQRQRIAIARAIISNPKLLVLDEATSALDVHAEQLVQAALDRISQHQTTMVITHKLNTIRDAEQILVLRGGTIIERGPHQSLIQQNGLYSRLLNLQNHAFQYGDQTTSSKSRSSNWLEHVPEEKDELTPESLSDEYGPAALECLAPQSHNRSLPGCIIAILNNRKAIMVLFLTGSVLSIGAASVYPAQAVVFAKSVFIFHKRSDEIKAEGSFWALMWFVLGLGVLLMFVGFGLAFDTVEALLFRQYRLAYFVSMMRQKLEYFAQSENSAAKLATRLTNHTAQLELLVAKTCASFLLVGVNVVTSCILSLAVAWKLALVAMFVVFPLIIMAGYLQSKLVANSEGRIAPVYEESVRFATEAIDNLRTVTALVMEPQIQSHFEQKLRGPLLRSYKSTMIMMLLFALAQSANLIGSALCFWYGGRLVVQGHINTYQFFVVFIATMASGDGAGNFIARTQSILSARSAINSIFQLQEDDPDSSPCSSEQEKRLELRSVESISFRNVTFAYPSRPQAKVLQDCCLHVKAGENIAIVGATGSGKSTIIQLLERFYAPSNGTVVINTNPIQSFRTEELRAMISLVSQTTTLYHGSIRENLLLGVDDQPRVSNLSIIEACRKANIHNFILSLPDGYSTMCGPKSLQLSGGQRQRLAIARALIRDTSILLLDEATSSLDSESEQVVLEAIENAASGKLTVTVAHRLSTIRNADRIYVLSNGKVEETGTHDELLAKRGYYYTMYSTQKLDLDQEP